MIDSCPLWLVAETYIVVSRNIECATPHSDQGKLSTLCCSDQQLSTKKKIPHFVTVFVGLRSHDTHHATPWQRVQKKGRCKCAACKMINSSHHFNAAYNSILTLCYSVWFCPCQCVVALHMLDRAAPKRVPVRPSVDRFREGRVKARIFRACHLHLLSQAKTST